MSHFASLKSGNDSWLLAATDSPFQRITKEITFQKDIHCVDAAWVGGMPTESGLGRSQNSLAE